jgi:hypothetical protein
MPVHYQLAYGGVPACGAKRVLMWTSWPKLVECPECLKIIEARKAKL